MEADRHAGAAAVLLLSALVLVPSYPYYVTFFYNALGIFLMLQAARENRDVYYMALLPLTKRDLVRARFSTIVTLQLLQALVCVPFMLLRRGYAEINNPVGIEANLAFLGFGFMLMGLFDLVFLPMHYKTATISANRLSFPASCCSSPSCCWRRSTTSSCT